MYVFGTDVCKMTTSNHSSGFVYWDPLALLDSWLQQQHNTIGAGI